MLPFLFKRIALVALCAFLLFAKCNAQVSEIQHNCLLPPFEIERFCELLMISITQPWL
jgi:hypothetical protein